jgi:hypothetical protein
MRLPLTSGESPWYALRPMTLIRASLFENKIHCINILVCIVAPYGVQSMVAGWQMSSQDTQVPHITCPYAIDMAKPV